jgi:anti-sigma factor (TIGR02949 family)
LTREVNPHLGAPTEGSPCSSVIRLLGAHADGQLDAATTLEVDDHLASCEACRERVALDRAIRGSLKKAVKTNAPYDMRSRMLAAMSAATAPVVEEAPAHELEPAPAPAKRPAMLRHWRTTLPFASAAAVALAWGMASRQPMASSDMSTSARAGFSNDELVQQFVDVHSHPMRPETADTKQVRDFEREVGVPVHVVHLDDNARFVGGRLLPVQGGERAAMLQYEVVRDKGDVRRVSVFVYDPRRVQIHSAEQLPPRAVGTAEVRVGQARGYSLAVAQHGDVGYAVATDMDESCAQYVAAVERE